ncbi:hypothetical protein PMAYCL1PPCAC_19739, partial [Pristionchus mayeri]
FIYSSGMARSALLLFAFAHLFIVIRTEGTKCVPNITSVPELSTYHLNGSWFMIARKSPAVDYLPLGISSSLIRLIDDGRDLIMEEYHSINGTCMPRMHGRWRRLNDSDGYLMEVRNPTGSMFQ